MNNFHELLIAKRLRAMTLEVDEVHYIFIDHREEKVVRTFYEAIAGDLVADVKVMNAPVVQEAVVELRVLDKLAQPGCQIDAVSHLLRDALEGLSFGFDEGCCHQLL